MQAGWAQPFDVVGRFPGSGAGPRMVWAWPNALALLQPEIDADVVTSGFSARLPGEGAGHVTQFSRENRCLLVRWNFRRDGGEERADPGRAVFSGLVLLCRVFSPYWQA